MGPKISVIIPTLNATGVLGPCLAALMPAVGQGLVKQVILADGGSDDGIAEVADELGCELIVADMGRGNQLRAGADVATGDLLLFLHADTVLGEGWNDEVIHWINRGLWREKACVGRLAFDQSGFMPRLVAGWANLRTRVFGLPYGDQSLLIPRKLYASIGGFDAIPLMEDVAIMRRLRGRKKMLPYTARTSADKYRDQGWIGRGARNWVTFIRYKLGADPSDLAKFYRR